jgi:hypothetical protein
MLIFDDKKEKSISNIMKKGFYFIMFFCFNLVICIAQSPNNEQHLRGTWIDEDDNSSIWTFNSNGILIIGFKTFNYLIDRNKIIIIFMEETNQIHTIELFFVFSDDGRIRLRYNENLNKTNSAFVHEFKKRITLIKRDE